MTTTVKISAHCASNVEVKVTVTDGENQIEQFTLQDKETAERYVYDKRSITVTETNKE